MPRVHHALAIAALFVLSSALGCGKTPSVVTGKVTFNNQAVGKGAITFLPADGKGPADGGQIIDGQYRVEIKTPGKKLVQVAGVKKIQFATSTEEMAKQAEEALATKTKPMQELADEIPSNADGNNTAVEISAGTQTLNFDLKSPAGKTR